MPIHFTEKYIQIINFPDNIRETIFSQMSLYTVTPRLFHFFLFALY